MRADPQASLQLYHVGIRYALFSGVVCKDRQGSVIETLYLSCDLCSVLGRYPYAVPNELRMRGVCKEKYRSKGEDYQCFSFHRSVPVG